jgi:PAS domain S-box-containing protein
VREDALSSVDECWLENMLQGVGSAGTSKGRAIFDSPYWRGLCVALALLILFIDSLTPLGFATGSLYLIPLMMVALGTSEAFTIGYTLATIVLTVIGFFLSPPGIDLFYVIVNRTLSIIELGLLCGTSIFVKRQFERQGETSNKLQHSQSLLDEQRKLLSIAAETARMGGWRIKLPEMKVEWSDFICELVGVPPGYSPTLEESRNFLAPEWRDIVSNEIQLALQQSKPFDLEAEQIARNGRRIWVRITGDVVCDVEGHATYVQGFTQDLSIEKENQYILVQLKRRFHQLADAVPQIIFTAEADGEPDYANRALLSYCGVSNGQQLRGEGWLSLIHPDDLPAVHKTWPEAVATGLRYAQEVRFRRHDGQYRWHVVQAEPLRDSDGNVIRWCGSAIDVHDTRMLAEQHSNILETITDAFLKFDKSWNFVYVNKEAERLMRTSRDELLGAHAWTVFPDAGTFERHYTRAVEGQMPVAFEEFYARLGKWLDVRAFPVADGLVVYFRDVTTRHFQAEEMRQARERFELLARATTDAVRDWNLVTDQLWWNDSMETLFGYADGDLPPDSRSWSEQIHPDDKDHVLANIHRTLDGDRSDWSSEYRFCRKNGTYAYVLDKGFIIRNREGEAVRVVSGMVDITETRLLQQRLAQSQRLEALGQLTGGVAHDFNNLLTVIAGNGELLAEQMQASGEYSQLLDQINQAAARAGQLTTHLLAFARKQALEPRATDVMKLINGMEGLLRRTLMENFEIELVHGGGLWPALVDPARLESAVLNLCLNARDAMPDGGRLTIETCNASLDQDYANSHDEVLPGQYVMISVTDNGVGMAPETLTHVFDPFFTTKGPGKGTGLGLSMVYGFVKQSKGHIKIYTEQGHGTTVRIYLPKASDAKKQDVTRATPQLHGDNEVVLLVEDDEMVRTYAHHLLRDLGYRVLSASNGRDALELLNEHANVRLLFTDIIMPGGMNGRQLAEEACKLRPDLKVLYTSGYTENAIVHHGRLDPGVILLSKPYQRKDLVNKLRQVLGHDAKYS